MVKKKRKKTESKKRGASLKKNTSKKGKEEMEKAQVWSVDVLLAVVIFVAVILIFYTTMTARQGPELTDLESEAGSVKTELEQNHELGFITQGEINDSKLEDFVNMTEENYTEIKEKLGIKGDFCIFYEDTQGNIILIDNKTGIGGADILIGGYECGIKIT